jgi:CubicO group peptidase (beta-lactamase class C family)
MKAGPRFAFALLYSILCLATAHADPNSVDLAALDAYLARQVRDKDLVGASLAILQDGKLVLARGYGKSSLAPEQPVTPDTRFAVGSVTKQFTAACILLLAEDGRLSVNDTVARFYPKLTQANEITLLDLMHHVSGYPDYYPLDFVDRRLRQPITVDAVIRDYATGKLDFPPRTRWSYSNTGYVILGGIVEKASGEPFGQFLRRRILEPLGLKQTVFEPPASARGLAQGYASFALGPPEPAHQEAREWIFSAGGLYSTPSDLARWDLALMDGKLLKPESYRLLTMPVQLADGRTTNYACGLEVAERNGQRVLSHNGGVGGFVAMSGMIPATRSAAILLTNSENFFVSGAVHDHVLSALLTKENLATKPATGDTKRFRPEAPRIAGPPAAKATRDCLRQLQEGELDRSQLGADFCDYLSKERVASAAARLKPLGEPTAVRVENLSERGGMEVAVVRCTFNTTALVVLMYRTPNGKIQEFFLYKV